jgi:hypothetical protein
MCHNSHKWKETLAALVSPGSAGCHGPADPGHRRAHQRGEAGPLAKPVRQCEDVIAAAGVIDPKATKPENLTVLSTGPGMPSIQLAQALQFELCLRQKDVIGEWVPVAEPGMSSVTYHGRKWLCGLSIAGRSAPPHRGASAARPRAAVRAKALVKGSGPAELRLCWRNSD